MIPFPYLGIYRVPKGLIAVDGRDLEDGSKQGVVDVEDLELVGISSMSFHEEGAAFVGVIGEVG